MFQWMGIAALIAQPVLTRSCVAPRFVPVIRLLVLWPLSVGVVSKIKTVFSRAGVGPLFVARFRSTVWIRIVCVVRRTKTVTPAWNVRTLSASKAVASREMVAAQQTLIAMTGTLVHQMFVSKMVRVASALRTPA